MIFHRQPFIHSLEGEGEKKILDWSAAAAAAWDTQTGTDSLSL